MKSAIIISSALVGIACAFVLTPASQQHVLQQSPTDMRLIELAPNVQKWLTDGQVNELVVKGTHFMDITDYQDLAVKSSAFASTTQSLVEIPQTPRVPEMIFPMISELRTDTMKAFLTKFTEFKTRYYKSETGFESAEFLYKTLSDMIEQSGKNITIRKHTHPWKQFSIIVRFEPSQTVVDDTVIVGAHQDSVNGMNPYFGRSPGADDDGSGATTTLEVFRVLSMARDYVPDRPLEFHWYSAEEGGLLGSQSVAAEYKSQGRKIVAMLQNDMTGYVSPKDRSKPVMGVVGDFVDPTLTAFIKKLINKYADLDYVDTRCGYGCSDHASWNKAGYRSAFPFEGKFGDISPFVHSTRDTIDTVDFEHMKEFGKLALSFAVELSHI